MVINKKNMSKAQNYIIVLGGGLFIIGTVIFGIYQFIVYSEKPDTQQILDFFKYVIPSIIGTVFVIVRILNYVERKELKKATELANEYAEENKQLYKANVKQLTKVEEHLAIHEKIQEDNDAEHKVMKKDIQRIESKIDKHIIGHAKTG